MSEHWYFKCLTCGEYSENRLNHGDNILLNILGCVDIIKNLSDSDKYKYLEISILGKGSEPIDFLMNHYGEGHDVVVISEYGTIKGVDSTSKIIEEKPGITFEIDEEEEKKIDEWLREIRIEDMCFPVLSYHFRSLGNIGMEIKVIEHITGKELDLTDESKW